MSNVFSMLIHFFTPTRILKRFDEFYRVQWCDSRSFLRKRNETSELSNNYTNILYPRIRSRYLTSSTLPHYTIFGKLLLFQDIGPIHFSDIVTYKKRHFIGAVSEFGHIWNSTSAIILSRTFGNLVIIPNTLL